MKKTFVLAVLLVVVQFSFGQQLTDLSGDYLGQTTSGNTPVAFATVLFPGTILITGRQFSQPMAIIIWKAITRNPVEA